MQAFIACGFFGKMLQKCPDAVSDPPCCNFYFIRICLAGKSAIAGYRKRYPQRIDPGRMTAAGAQLISAKVPVSGYLKTKSPGRCRGFR
jgi:hypothetical protein